MPETTIATGSFAATVVPIVMIKILPELATLEPEFPDTYAAELKSP